MACLVPALLVLLLGFSLGVSSGYLLALWCAHGKRR